MLTPHLPGSAAALGSLIPEMEEAADFKQPHAVRRSVGFLAIPLRVLTPLQQAGVTGPLPFRYLTHGAKPFSTLPHVMAASASGAATAMHTMTAKANLNRDDTLAIFQ
ncbi:hypothetical protein Nepgr_011866 [Nepenthes gracilis]|uniref:Uncharacterized protein n=1 Tax=Nepenthes gracilis TaxID=150966 RepID=A0AAD3SEU4_NEPGR|nr:hypothetical protein Nepgr_011866 [Nepenthes gracilis]